MLIRPSAAETRSALTDTCLPVRRDQAIRCSPATIRYEKGHSKNIDLSLRFSARLACLAHQLKLFWPR